MMSKEGRNQGKKKSKFNFRVDRPLSHSLNIQLNEEQELGLQTSASCHNDSNFSKSLKKFKTSSFKFKKKSGADQDGRSKPENLLSFDDFCVTSRAPCLSDNSGLLFPNNQSLFSCKNSGLQGSSSCNHAMLAGVGFLGNVNIFQAKSNFGLQKIDLKQQHGETVVLTKNKVPDNNVEAIHPVVNIEPICSLSDHENLEAAACQPKASECQPTNVIDPAILVAEYVMSSHETEPGIASPVGEATSSPDSPRDDNVWKTRVKEIRGTEISECLPPQHEAIKVERKGIQNRDSSDHLPPGCSREVNLPDECYDDDVCCFAGWEARTDDHGRVFYVNHVDKTTSWLKPEQKSCRCCSGCNKPGPHEGRNHEPPITLEPSASSSSSSSSQVKNKHHHPPAVVFLTRPDFYAFLRKNQEALSKYNQNPHLKHMITRVRSDSMNFIRYQHNRDLVSFLNAFSDSGRRLPTGWERRFDKSSRPFFVDHLTCNTTFIDPRLPSFVPTSPDGVMGQSPGDDDHTEEERHRHPRSFSVPRNIHRPASPENETTVQSWGNKVVRFLRQPNVLDVLCRKSPGLASDAPLGNKIAAISERGQEALQQYADDLDLNILLSQFESEISAVGASEFPKSRSFMRASIVQSFSDHSSVLARHDFQTRLGDFYKRLESKGYATGPWKTKLEINRTKILEDALKKVLEMTKKDMQRNKLLISFVGEEGLDYGGPSKEFFFLLSRELFNPCYGLFEYSSCSSYTLQISPMSMFLEGYQDWFRFTGRVIGLAVLHQHLLDVFFVRPLYKALLKETISLADLENVDDEFFKSLSWILNGDDVDFKKLGLTFSVDEDLAGKVTEVELKPNGSNVAVTRKNRKDYVDRMVRWRVLRGIKEQTDCLIRGFHEVLDHRLLSKFDAHELEFVISGTTEVDVEDWRRNTDYRAGYHDSHVVIEWFWLVVDGFTSDQRLRLLQFVTGTSSLPHEGFSALRGHNGPKKFSIEKWGEITSLPRAHTCFNRLDLPPYTSLNTLRRKLIIAIEETSSYGIE